MRRAVVILTAIVATLVLASGVALAATRFGTEGDDRLRGTPGVDRLVGYGGDDTIHGLPGDDYPSLGGLFGGEGNDFIHYGPVKDRVYGVILNDLLYKDNNGI